MSETERKKSEFELYWESLPERTRNRVNKIDAWEFFIAGMEHMNKSILARLK